MEYELYIYETWGNARDGFDVNNVYRGGQFTAPEEMTDKEVLKLMDAQKHVAIDHNIASAHWYEFVDKRNGKPLGRLVGKPHYRAG